MFTFSLDRTTITFSQSTQNTSAALMISLKMRTGELPAYKLENKLTCN